MNTHSGAAGRTDNTCAGCHGGARRPAALAVVPFVWRMCCKHPLTRSTQSTRSGPAALGREISAFTLVEVLLALGLMALVLAVLWSVFGVFNRFFEVAPVQAAQAQLVVALAQQLADDLNCAIEDSPSQDPNRPSAAGRANAGPVRRFGLLGTSDSLRIDVLQRVPPTRAATSPAGPAALAYGQATGPRVPELRTVFYRLVSAPAEDHAEQPDATSGSNYYLAVAERNSAPGGSGLVRWELDFETPVDPDTLALVEELGLDPQMLYEPGTMFPPQQRATWVTEVVGLRFRYFDGKSWSSSWNSLQRKSLPVAVEVTFQLQPPQRRFVPRPIQPQPDDFAPSYMLEEEQWAELAAGGTAPAPSYRFVIHLAGARTRPEIILPEYMFAWDDSRWENWLHTPEEPVETSQFEPEAEAPQPVVPRYVPPPQPGVRPAQPRPDQWMRSAP